MPSPVPSIDQNPCITWNEQERAMYNSLDFFLAKYDVKYRKTWATHSRLVGKMKWTRNQGPIMRGVRKERSPHIRQEAMPAELCATPKKDVIDIQEVIAESTLKRHRFESRIFDFCPEFTDFMGDHISPTSKDMSEKILRYEDIFVRTGVFHMSPHVFVANRPLIGGERELVVSPRWDGKDMANITNSGKNLAWRQAMIATVGNPGNLSLCNVFLADSILREDLRAPAWSGGDSIPADNSPLMGKNVLTLSNEAFNQFIHDPFLQLMKNCDMDIIHDGFRGSLFGRITTKIEDLPLRMAEDGTFPTPEIREINPAAYNENETTLNPAYRDALYEWAFLYGGEGYKSIEVGPPPDNFVGKTKPKGFRDMFWNGEVRFSKDFNIPCVDQDGNTTWETNEYGEKMRLISSAVFGIFGSQTRNVLPILFKRIRGC